MKFSPHLAFDGRCEEAFRFYHACLGGQLAALVKYADTPVAAQTPAEWHGKIVHARLVVGDAVLMGSDAPPGRYVAPGGTMTMLGVETPAEAERVFAALAEGGSVGMKMEETFFALRFGMLRDRFDIPWMVICERPQHEMCEG